MKIDVLIVGQGLAGSLLAWQLIKQKFRVLVIDDVAENASQVAAGLINPISGQRLFKSDEVDSLLPAALNCYQLLSAQFQQDFFVPLPMLRVLRTDRELQRATARLVQPDYQAYLQDVQAQSSAVNSSFGVLRQLQTGYLRTRLLLDQLRRFLIAEQSYLASQFDYSELLFQPQLQWRHYLPRQIVFCEGYKARRNPWFSRLPFQLVKGEIISCETTALSTKQIINFGNWLIPLDNQRCRIGANYNTAELDQQTTASVASQLLVSALQVCPQRYPLHIYQHQAGVRPATLDKQPFIGRHPVLTQLHIFNGFGSKGSLAIPWYAQRMVDFLVGQQSLPTQSNIQRFYGTHFSC